MLHIDHIHFFVENALAKTDWFIKVMGFQSFAEGKNADTYTFVIASGNRVKFLVSSPISNAGPVAEYLRAHPPGVADVAFAVSDLDVAISQSLSKGAKIIQPIQQWHSSKGRLRWATILSKPKLYHTLVERLGITPVFPWLEQQSYKSDGVFQDIDHVVLNVPQGTLNSTVSWYSLALGFQAQQTFTIQTERSALFSQVMIHPDSGVRFPVNEPRSPNSQIQEFLDLNHGPGIQHIALQTNNIAQVTAKLKAQGLNFLNVPANYYEKLQYYYSNFGLSQKQWQQLVQEQILIDFPETDDEYVKPLLLQTFTQPIFKEPTFFFELIERRDQAQGFGEGNFKALFEAVEKEQLKRGLL